MNAIALLVLLALPTRARTTYALAPTAGYPTRFAVSVDAEPGRDPLGAVSLPVGAVVTIVPEKGARLHGTLIGPKGMHAIASNGPWSRRFDVPGGYRLEFDREDDEELPGRVDFVVQGQDGM